MRFEPGKSGNPGGRPKGVAEVAALAREHTAAAIAALVEIVNDKKAPKPARVSAASVILDRGWGKAVQHTEHTGQEGGPILLAVDRPPPETREEWLARRNRELSGGA